MPKFEEKFSSLKRKREKLIGKLLIIAGVGLVLLNFLTDGMGWRQFISIIIGINIFGSGYQLIKRRKPLYFEFDETKIEWLVFEKSTQITWVSWDDIKWIKKENSGGITFFRESSFSEHFTMKWMTVEQQKELFAQIEETANSKQIRMVNF
jgi:hypothetical protein